MNEELLTTQKSKFNTFKTQLQRSFTIAGKDLKIYYNKPPVIIQGIFFPLILFFAFSVGRIISPVYLVSGITVMVLFMTSTSLGPIIFPWETMRGTFERLTTFPISSKTILIGSIWGSFLYGLLFASIPFVIGIIFLAGGMMINYFLIITAIIISAFVFACFGLIMAAPPIKNPGNTMVLQIFIKFPILFISPLFMPISSLPTAVVSPLTYCLDIINVGLGEISAFGPYGLLIDFGILLGFGLGFLFIAFAIHQKTLERRFK